MRYDTAKTGNKYKHSNGTTYYAIYVKIRVPNHLEMSIEQNLK